MHLRRVCPLAIAFTVLCVAVPARAWAGDWLAYHAPASCPTEAQFVAAVGARGGRATPTTYEQKMDVDIHQETDGFAGTFQVHQKDSVSDVRQVRGPRCTEVVDGLAVVTAIALAEHPSDTPTAPASSPGLSPTARAPTAAPPAPPTATRADDDDEPYLRKSADVFTNDVAVGAGTLRFRSLLTTTLSGGVAVGVIPSTPLARLDLNIFRGNFATVPNALTYLVGPVVRARVSLLGGTHQSDGYSTAATGFAFGMSVCRSPVYDTRGFTLLGCIEYSGGFMKLDTRTAGGARTQSKTSATAMVGIGGEAEYNFGKYFHLDLKIGGDFSFGKLSAERPDGSTLFASQPFSAYVLLGAGLHF